MIPATMSIDSRVFRQAVGQFVTGVTVIAIEVDDEIRAMTANSFTSLSLDPPLVLFCLGRQTKAGHLSTYFAGAWKHAAPPPFTFTSWREGAPRLDGSAVSLGCVTQSIHEGGDHFIVVGEVVAIHRSEEPQPPLVFFGGRYMSLKQLS
jgi:3-hydroxy-9,10-secoandrosta-1,3,5(10)-triene-9,17-dione monooxygenase reductase component